MNKHILENIIGAYIVFRGDFQQRLDLIEVE